MYNEAKGENMLDQIKGDIAITGFSQSQLSELITFIRDLKTSKGARDIGVGSSVMVVEKTKRTPGIVTKMNRKRAQVRMDGRTYNVPFSMLEAA
jgi:hypothetical protein|tara:strand:+ start:90 stop:371 length:282 start_codon:yes stop_codon:yes gene_type:complete